MRAFASLLLLSACAATPPPPAAAPTPAPTPTPPPAAAAAPARPKAAEVPPTPAACAPYLELPLACDTQRSAPERLAEALGESESLTRNRKLACLEPEMKGVSGLLRALRADLAPIACADALTTPYIEAPSEPLTPAVESSLIGLMIAGRLSRLAATPPTLSPPFDKPHFQDFFENSLKPWILSEALAIGNLSQDGAKLNGYGKAVAAVEAGLTDLRFVEVVRKIPLPTELASDAEVRNVYYAALDEALEPRKARGRDAALVGLRILAELGVLSDPRVDRARRVLAELYGGSRVNALDRLLLPDMPALHLESVEQKLAARLPTYYALELLANLKDPADAKLLRAFAERGLPVTFRARLDAATLSAESRTLYAQLELRRGLLYFSAPALGHAAVIADAAATDPANALLAALGHALESAPKDAAQLMLGSPRLSGPLGSLAALDALAAKKGKYAGEAEFDAATVSALTPPDNDAKFWRELALRYARAAKGLREAKSRTLAKDLADDAQKTADTLGRAAPAPVPPAHN